MSDATPPGDQHDEPGPAVAPPPLPTAAQLDQLEADLGRIDADLAQLDQEG